MSEKENRDDIPGIVNFEIFNIKQIVSNKNMDELNMTWE
jgi:hypothetical protein